jgi:hypothetical protein
MQVATSTTASKMGRLMEKRIETRFKVHGELIEFLDENTLVLAYGDCCFGIDHMIRYGSRYVIIQDKWENSAPKLRDLRHFVVASSALQNKLPLLESPLKIFLSKRRITAPESLFTLQASSTESLSDFSDIEKATEEVYKRVCKHFNLIPKELTADLIEELKTMTEEFENATKASVIHRLQPTISGLLAAFGSTTVPPLLKNLYGEQIAQDIIAHVQDLAANCQIGQILKFFKGRRATPIEYDVWLAVLTAVRPIQLDMEKVNAETGRRIYTLSQIGEAAIVPSEFEQTVERSRLINRHKRKTIIKVIKEGAVESNLPNL